MNPLVELNLALILFLPWFAILSMLFWVYPRSPRDGRRAAFDAASLALSAAAAFAGMHWSMASADPGFGPMWAQVLATSVAYGLYLLVMTTALLVRRRWLRPRAGTHVPSASPSGEPA